MTEVNEILKDMNFSLEEFFLLADASKPVPFWVNSQLMGYEAERYKGAFGRTIAEADRLGYKLMPIDSSWLSLNSSSGFFNLKNAVLSVCEPKVALYLHGCFCCWEGPKIPELYEDGRIGVILPREIKTQDIAPWVSRDRDGYRARVAVKRRGLALAKTVIEDASDRERAILPERANTFRIIA